MEFYCHLGAKTWTFATARSVATRTRDQPWRTKKTEGTLEVISDLKRRVKTALIIEALRSLGTPWTMACEFSQLLSVASVHTTPMDVWFRYAGHLLCLRRHCDGTGPCRVSGRKNSADKPRALLFGKLDTL